MSDRKFVHEKLSNAFSQLPYLPRAFSLVWQAARIWTAWWLLLLVVQGLLPAAVVLLLRALVDELVVIIGSAGAWEEVWPLAVLAVLMGGALLLQELLRGVTSWVRSAQALLVQDYISAIVHRQSVALDLSFYDSPEYYDHLHRARHDAGQRPTQLLESLGGLLRSGITLVAMSANTRLSFDLSNGTNENFRKLEPFVNGGIGLAYVDRGVVDEVGFLIHLGFGVAYTFSTQVAVQTAMQFNIIPGDAAGEKFYYTWQIAGIRYQF